MSTAQILWEDLNLGQKPEPMFLKLEGDSPSNTRAAVPFVPSQVLDFVNRKALEGMVCKDSLIRRW